MSRARPITFDGETYWFDTARNHEKATEEQLELLASVLEKTDDVDIEDVLDASTFGYETLSQGEVVKRLREALGLGGIPEEVIRRRERWREERATAPCCRMCGKEGDSTKHHFVNKWILRELDGYHSKWADRRKNCIPLCIRCHRDIHSKANGPHSIAHLLDDNEKQFAAQAIEAFVEQHPRMAWIVVRGEDSVYETRLMRDWIEGRFSVEGEAKPDTQPAHQLLAA